MVLGTTRETRPVEHQYRGVAGLRSPNLPKSLAHVINVKSWGFDQAAHRPLPDDAWALLEGRCSHKFDFEPLPKEAEPVANMPLLMADAAVGAAFLAGAVLARAPRAPRLLWAAVGVAWFLGDWPELRTLHQGVLLLALAWLSYRRRWVIVLAACCALLVAAGFAGQMAASVLFGTLAVLALGQHRRLGSFIPAAAGGVATVLASTWAWNRLTPSTFSPVTTLLGYQAVLLVIAVAYPVWTRWVGRIRAGLTDRFLAMGVPPAGVPGLEMVLQDTLRDRSLRISTSPVETSAPRGIRDRQLTINDGTAEIAVVTYRSAVLDDPATRKAVIDVVSLIATHERRQRTYAEQLIAVEAARSRILEAVDQQRGLAAAELRQDLAQLARARAEISSARTSADHDTALVLDLIENELVAVSGEIEEMVAGVPAADLGGGRLGTAIESLAAHCAIPTAVTVGEDVAASTAVEAALFYVCSEALANVVKHARAGRVEIALHRDGPMLAATVTDDGVGGADPTGSGLTGLADRLAALGGRLRVISPPGVGTNVMAEVPIS